MSTYNTPKPPAGLLSSTGDPARPRPAGTRATFGWMLVGVLWCICFLNYADRQAISSLLPLLRTGLGLAPSQLGLIASAFMWAYALFGPAAGWLGDRMSRPRLIVLGLAVWIALEFAAAHAERFGVLVAIRAFSGLGEALYFPSALALLSTWHGPATRSRALALHQSAVYVGSICGGIMGGVVGQRSGWREPFLIFSIAGAALLVPVLLAMFHAERRQSPHADRSAAAGEPRSGGPSLWFAAAELARSPRVRLLFGVFFAANAVAMTVITWLPFFLATRLHWSVREAGISAALYLQSASVAGVLAGGFWADRLVRRWTQGRLLTQMAGLLLGSGFLAGIGFAQSRPAVLCSLAGFGFCKGVYDANIFAGLYDFVPAPLRSSATGLMNSVGWLGGGMATLLMGMGAGNIHLGVRLASTSVVYLGLGLLLLASLRRSRIRR